VWISLWLWRWLALVTPLAPASVSHMLFVVFFFFFFLSLRRRE